MRIFKDRELTNECIESSIDLGSTIAGQVSEHEYFVLNDGPVPIVDLVFSFDNPEIEVVEAPKELPPRTSGSIKIKWYPSLTLKRGLKTELKIAGYELYKPE